MARATSRKPKQATFEQLNKYVDSIETVVDRGVDFGGFEGSSTKNHDEFEAFKSRLITVFEKMDGMEKVIIDEGINAVIAPLLAKANGDVDVLSQLVSAALTPVKVVDAVSEDVSDAHFTNSEAVGEEML